MTDTPIAKVKKLTETPEIIYEVPANTTTMIKNIRVTNTLDTSAVFTLWMGYMSEAYCVIPYVEITALGHGIDETFNIMETGYYLYGYSYGSVDHSVHISIYGVEFT